MRERDLFMLYYKSHGHSGPIKSPHTMRAIKETKDVRIPFKGIWNHNGYSKAIIIVFGMIRLHKRGKVLKERYEGRKNGFLG